MNALSIHIHRYVDIEVGIKNDGVINASIMFDRKHERVSVLELVKALLERCLCS